MYGNNAFDNLERQGTTWNFTGSQFSWKPQGEAAKICILKASDLRSSQTVQNKMNEYVKKGPYKGEFERPYIDSNGTNSLVDEIINGGTPVQDSWLKNGLRWDVPGYFRGSDGNWELVVNLDTNTIVHFNFVAK